jgi:hypothetical protein
VDDSGTVVITATRKSLREALERCEQGGCTLRQDVVASVRYAEALFRSGSYLDARRVLQRAIARDKPAAQNDPMAVSALYEATVTVALHDGDQEVARRASGARLRLIHDHFGNDDARSLQAELDNADMLITTLNRDEAAAVYPIVARRARAAHLPSIHAAAVLRQALVAHVDHREQLAKQLLTALMHDPVQSSAMQLAAGGLLARFARERGDTAAADALVSSYLAEKSSPTPVLVWQPPLSGTGGGYVRNDFDMTDPALRDRSFMRAVWADIGFLIKPDGTVERPEVLRGTRSQGWSEPIIAAIAQRRYLPASGSDAASYRIERWTFTGSYCVPGPSHIRQRACDPHFVQMDLTPAGGGD